MAPDETPPESDIEAFLRPAARLHGSLTRHLGLAILGGQYQPGDILPNEEDSSIKLGISRSAYREAVRYLAAKGLVESRTKMGTRVLPRERWNFVDPEVMEWTFEATPSATFIAHLFQLRLVVEPGAAELAARHRTDADLEKMERALDEMRGAPLGTEAGAEAGSRFHRAILDATGNEVLASLWSSINAAVRWELSYLRRRHAQLPEPFRRHARLFYAIARQDTAAAKDIMRGIVRVAYDEMQNAAGDDPADPLALDFPMRYSSDK